MNIRDVLGEDLIQDFFTRRVVCWQTTIDVPDGVYDIVRGPDLNSKTRMVIVDKVVMYHISHMWLANGGPPDLPKEITEPPFGSFPDYK